MKEYEIPGFPRYRVFLLNNGLFAVWDTESERFVEPADKQTNYPTIRLVKNGKRGMFSLIKIAALAFHGQPPIGYRAYHYRSSNKKSIIWNLKPTTVVWIESKEANSRRLRKLTLYQICSIREKYQTTDISIAQLARDYGVSPTTIRRCIWERGRDENRNRRQPRLS